MPHAAIWRPFTLLSTVAIVALAGCDPESFHGDPGDGTSGGDDGSMPGDAGHPGDDDDGYMPPPDDDGMGDDDGELACFDVSVEGPALLDHARCEGWNGEPIAACDSSNSLLRTCDHAFAAWCNDQGGDIRACTREELPVQVFYTCSDVSPIDASCTQRFYDACDSQNGFGYTADPTALSGGCRTEDTPALAWCCQDSPGTGVGTGCLPAGGQNCPSGQTFLNCTNGETCPPSESGGGSSLDCTCN